MDLFESAKRPLIALPPEPSIDAIASAVALMEICNQKNKAVDVVSPGFIAPSPLSFLPGTTHIKTKLESLKQFLITIDTSKTPLADFNYAMGENEISIFLSPREGMWSENDVRVRGSTWLNDLAIVIDSRDLDTLGSTFEKHTEFFYQTPIINVDHHMENGNFGQINLINTKASSVAEILYDTIAETRKKYINDTVATALLAGIIAKTQSFRLAASPRTLLTASNLIEQGADRTLVVKNLYQQKTLATLRLWGRVLARLQSDPETKLVWSLIPKTDFEKSGGNATDLPMIIDEMITNAPQAGIVVLLFENENKRVQAFVRLLRNHFNLMEILETFAPAGNTQSVSFVLPETTTLEQAETLVVHRIQEYVKK